jgi:hypothetical protein
MSEKRTSILGWLTLIAVLAAIWVMFGEGRQTSSIGRGEPLIAGLMDRVEQTQKIMLSKSGESLTIVANGSDWQIEERAFHKADASKVRGLLRSLALSERREPKTGNEARLERIGLGADALHVSLFDKDGKTLAALNIGNQRTGADGHSHAYVQVDFEPKSWLVTAVPALDLNIANWVDNKIIEINAERIKKIDFDLEDGIDYALVREVQGADFGLNDIKPGEKSVAGYSLNEAAALIADLSFHDVRKSRDDGVPHTVVTVSTFDGLLITLSIARSDDELWVSTQARYDIAVAQDGPPGEIYGAPDDGKLEADLYNERHDGWQYRLKESDLAKQTSERDTYIAKDE